jgi:hypothetical protein
VLAHEQLMAAISNLSFFFFANASSLDVWLNVNK